ncbi:MAG: hypothetical protein IPG76_18790 [Acidobacteria bacterium]|nr:hypothetical protein [Acidobacteriota bacterium]
MTTLKFTIVLPDTLAREAEANGMLTSQFFESLLRGEIRRRRIAQLFEAADRLSDIDISPLAGQEIEAEIQAVREARRSIDASGG